MFHYLNSRSQSVITTSLYQNDCSIGGLRINVLENKLYYLQENALYVVDWTMDNNEPEIIYQSMNKLRNLNVTHEFIGFIEEGTGLVLLETQLQTEFCKISSIKEQFTLYDDQVMYNIGLNVFRKELFGRELPVHCFTALYPITQLIEDEDTIIVQMESPDFKRATKLVWNKEYEGERLEESSFRILTTRGIRYYAEQYFKKPSDTEVTFYKDMRITPLCEYIHEVNVIICYEKSGYYYIARGQDINEVYAILDKKPKWFAYLGNLIVYSSYNKIYFVRVPHSDIYQRALEEKELRKEQNKIVRERLNSPISVNFDLPIIDTPSPNQLFELLLLSEESVKFSGSAIPLPQITCEHAHLDIVTGDDISLIAIAKIVERVEGEYPDTEFQWKVIRSQAIREDMAIVYCAEL